MMAPVDFTFSRFARNVDPTPDGCWIWRGYMTPKGYGVIQVKGRKIRVHRWAYEHWFGPISDGMVVNHLCRNRACVFPGHLELLTNAQNTIAGLQGAMSMHLLLNGYDHRACPPNQCTLAGQLVEKSR